MGRTFRHHHQRQERRPFFLPILVVIWISLFAATTNGQQQQQVSDADNDSTKFYPATLSSEFDPTSYFSAQDNDYDYYGNPTQVNFRQDICGRQQQYANGEIPLRQALSGLELHPVFTYAVPEIFDFIEREAQVETTELDEFGRDVKVNTTQVMMGYNPSKPGLMVRLFEEIAERANFTWKNSYAIVGGVDGQNTTYDDLAVWMTDTYDVAVFALGHLPHRFEMGLNFPAGITDNTIIMIGLQDDGSDTDTLNQLLTVFQPFSWQVWVIIVCTIFFSALISWILEYDRTPPEDRSWRPQTRNVFWASMAFTGNFDVSEITTNPNMIFQFSLSFWALLIVSAYTANLASFFVVQNTPSLNIDTLEEAMQYQLPICVNRGTYIDVVLSQRYPSSTNVIQYAGITEAYTALRNRECTILATEVDVWNANKGSIQINAGCQMKQIGRAYQFLQGGFAIKADHGTLCSSLIRDVLNIHILEMMGSNPNVVEEIKTETFYVNEQDCSAIAAAANNDSADSDTYQLNLKEMAGTFALHALLTMLALLLALFNKVKKKVCGSTKKRSSRKKLEEDGGDGQQEDSTDDDNDNGIVPMKASPLLLNQGKMIEQLIQIQLDMKADMANMSNQLHELSSSSSSKESSPDGNIAAMTSTSRQPPPPSSKRSSSARGGSIRDNNNLSKTPKSSMAAAAASSSNNPNNNNRSVVEQHQRATNPPPNRNNSVGQQQQKQKRSSNNNASTMAPPPSGSKKQQLWERQASDEFLAT